MSAAIVAIVGFYVFMIFAVWKISDAIKAKAGWKSALAEMELLRSRIDVVEQQLGLMGNHILELKDGHEFALKLLSEKKQSNEPVKKADKVASA